MSRKQGYIILILWTVLAACSTTKTVPEGDRLFTGSDIRWNGKKPKDKGALNNGMEDRLRPSPNKKTLGIPVKLLIYNLGKDPGTKTKGLNYLLRKKWGEAPVLLSQVKPGTNSLILENYLEDNGYFQADVRDRVIRKGEKKASITYTATPHTRYIVDSVVFEIDSTTALGGILMANTKKSVLKTGSIYRLDDVKTERERMHAIVKERGFYYFTPDYILIQADSTHQGKVNLFVQVKKETPKTALQQYRMRNVTLFTNYSLNADTMRFGGLDSVRAMRRADSTRIRRKTGFNIIDPDTLFKPIVFERSVFLKRDSLYRLSSHNITLQRLVNLGVFKFVRGQFRTARDSGYLNASFYLTPYPKRSLQADLTGYSKSSNFVGSQLNVSAKNRNWLHAANLLEIKLGAGFETQVGGGSTQLNTSGYSLTGDVSVTIPRFVAPVKGINIRTPFVPRTKISIGYELLSRPSQYNLNAFYFQFGYLWKKTKNLEHQLNPIAITYVLPTKLSEEFIKQQSQDLALQQSVSKQFLLGGNYTITFNNLAEPRYHTFYGSFNTDISGNIAGLLIPKADSQKLIFNNPFSQYVRLTLEGRHYWKLADKLTWVNRALVGYGIPYGNFSTLPFVKQYFIGGSNSLRAFRARTIGPGTYRAADADSNRLLANQAGDIKLELNSELRYKPMNRIEFAAFYDAGNIWLRNRLTGKEGGEFIIGQALSQLAMGTGLGLRVDASILIIRFDVAFPLRKPWLPEGERWVGNQIKFGDPDWRKENLVLNIAIGYPF
ncbi:BamA/TamA family outer membrane protein [uncultured Chitinophaga sp.]|uniref:translocation and assembly module lipoprotein TamL n=1 Tax=uncultured Chitinophaga sp. TaxID=339340 RepID=UPI0025F8151B|nr:BamA/TamA family outer membrane protein [uncultured Chitinophaga sp.]